jgi:hypothetical protein
LDPHKIVKRWINYFSQLLNVQVVGGVRHTELETAEPFVPELSTTEVEGANGKLKSYKLPEVDHIPAEVIQAGEKHCILRSTNILLRVMGSVAS